MARSDERRRIFPFLDGRRSVARSLPMSDPAKAELLRSLGRLLRGLTALFWGLPLTLLVYAQTAHTGWLDALGWFAIVPALLSTGLLWHGLHLMGDFQKQERVWIRALEQGQLLALTNLGLCPFLFWWHRLPSVPLYGIAVLLLTISSLAFLYHFNYLLQRLAAMLPDETLRHETRVFGSFNRVLILVAPLLFSAYFAASRLPALPEVMVRLLTLLEPPFGLWMILFLLLMPLAMTLALIWKIKETIFASVFGPER